jgi:signal peptidase I
VSDPTRPASDPPIEDAARKLAEQNQIDWRMLPGTGANGTVTTRDVLECLAQLYPSESAPSSVAVPSSVVVSSSPIASNPVVSSPTVSSTAPKPKPRPFWQRFWREIILETVLPVYLVITFAAIPVGVRGESMSPTLETGDYLIVLKAERWLESWGIRPNYIRRGDIIVTRAPEGNPASSEPISRYLESLPLLGFFNWDALRDVPFRPYLIKRVVGVPGDTVEVRAGVVYINETRLTETYASSARAVDDAMKTVVRPGTYYVMGDNRARGASLDSRAFGPVVRADIAGRAVFRLWPPNRIGAP